MSYAVIESIKDGYATTTKYNSTTIRFKTPNVVAVFDNEFPDFSQLSQDRWTCFTIGNAGNLIAVDAKEAQQKQRLKNEKKIRGCTEVYDEKGQLMKRILDKTT